MKIVSYQVKQYQECVCTFTWGAHLVVLYSFQNKIQVLEKITWTKDFVVFKI